MTEQPDSNTPSTPEQRPSSVLVLFLIVPLLGILVALLMVATNPNRNATIELPDDLNADNATLINYQAPPFELPLLTGGTTRLADYVGQPVFINFWQTTCEPCKREMPAFLEFMAEQGEDGVRVLAINFDETADQINTFLAEYNIVGLPIALDALSTVRRQYGVANIPVTFIVDGNGIVRHMKLGEMSLEDMQNYADLVE